MHVVFFGDQHAESSGGAQVSMRLQRRFLERAGHTVTIVAPRTRASHASDPAYLDLPSIPVTLDGEYGLAWPGRRTDRWLDAALAGRPPVDVVHVQADFWGALIGHRFAARHRLPVVHTMHNRVDVGIRATTPAPSLVLRALDAWAARQLRGVPPREGRRIAPTSHDPADPVRHPRDAATPARDGWAYLRRFAERSDAVTAPSSHFARRLRDHGCGVVDVVWNGIDDGLLDAVTATSPAGPARPRLVWIGRMSPEKRLLPFLEAVAGSGVDADVEVIGGGGQLRAARRLMARRRPTASVVFAGRLPYAETLARIAAADAVVQTSIGFETQGMTVFEAAALGTPAVVSDPDIADELGAGVWRTADGSVAALAVTLRRAVADIAAGSAPTPDPMVASRFRQSSRTAAMLAVYESVLAAR
ncbi:glycosyltransferase [Microbacterium sp. SORGH_AS_0888]|uniref:glycosyltransferase n=1 Tax=Microbacterium sp. SORGH_AS_0888 TaxID=3041791 RepID=UPI0027876437|nr:glycosyltransferase [Microbacterium sp. SORGH_AS_0888]MDQ1129786.1 1,2-diacylglycerol 3-alpha-glucosyltransferase [Microbacterium sp. SORGH_AS_0888]